MKLTIAAEHRDFFRKNGLIEFEGLLRENQLKDISASIDNTLCQRLCVPKEKIISASSEKLFMTGRDLWRDDPLLKKYFLQPSFAAIASELIELSPIRIGYDQFFIQKTSFPFLTGPYKELTSKTRTLKEISSLDGVVCGLMLCISASSDTPSETTSIKTPRLFSHIPGHGVFFRPDFHINFEELLQGTSSKYILIVYAKASTLYILQPEDPHAHALKLLGYGIGDKLSDKLNPILFR